ncbi:MAG: S8 family serine peptidase [Anaerolineae bacterium]|nr:S8 family serine peptidase [Anaerolineae bacterium]
MMRSLARCAVIALIVWLGGSLTSAQAEGPPPPRDTALQRGVTTPLTPTRILERTDKLPADADGRVHVIVELADPPLAKALAATDPAQRQGAPGKLDVTGAAAADYTQRLVTAQAQTQAAIAARFPRARVDHLYQVVFNGLALTVPPDDVAALAALPGVRRVHPDGLMHVDLDASLPLIGAPAAWQALGGVAQAGAGVKVAVVDTGIRPENPLFSGDGFSYPSSGGPWPKGDCVTRPQFCNGKIIAARVYPHFPLAPHEVLSPLDMDGHGSHTAGIAVGNTDVRATIGGIHATISGVAPRAWLMVYKALFSDGEGGAVGSVSNLTAALEDAVRDGADVINNSWGGTPGDPTGTPAAIAAENAVAAGVIVVFSAGNRGPEPGTLSTPGNTPGVITVGATTTTREFVADVQLAADDGPAFQVSGASIGQGASGIFASAEGVADVTGNRAGYALNAYPPGAFSGKIVLVKRGQLAPAAKSQHVAAGGAIGMVLYNTQPNQPLLADAHVIPTVHVDQAAGLALRDYLAVHPHPSVTLSPARPSATPPDRLAVFSGQGPNWDPAILKPDLVAPGVNILSAYSPANPLDGAPFAVLSGTSMATPHVAGAAALIRQRYPQFTPAQVKSALMTTARVEEVRLEGGEAATVLARGAGRVDVGQALDPGLVFDPPSLGLKAVVGRAQRTVRATNVAATAAVYTVSALAPSPNTQFVVEPSQFALAPGATVTLTVTADLVGGALHDYSAGQIQVAEVNGPHRAHLVTWLRAVASQVPARLDLTVRSASGDTPLTFTPNFDAPAPPLTVYGLVAPDRYRLSITADQDQTPDTHPLDPAYGWRVVTTTIEAATKLLVAQSGHGSAALRDVDLYVLRDANGDGRFDLHTEVVQASHGLTVDEELRIEDPLAGVYAIAAYDRAGQGDFDLRLWRVGSQRANFQAEWEPGPVLAGRPYTVRLRWQVAPPSGETLFGVVRLAAPRGEVHSIPVSLTRQAESDLTLDAKPSTVEAGRPVTYSYTVTNYDDQPVEYVLTDQLPANLRPAPDTLEGWTYDPVNQRLQTRFSLPPARTPIDFISSDGRPSAALRFIDLPTEFGTGPLPQGRYGDDVGIDLPLPEDSPALTYMGQTYRMVGLVSNGYLVPGGLQSDGDILSEPQRLPNPGRPNPIVAPFWADLDLGAGETGHGDWYAEVVTGGGFGGQHALVVQWREVELFAHPGTRYTFEVVMVLETGQVYYLYDTLAGPVSGASVGIESPTGGQGKSWYFMGQPAGRAPHSRLTLTLDINPDVTPYAQRTLTYRARPMTAGVFTNQVTLARADGTTRAFGTVSVTATRPSPQTLTLTARPDRTGYARPLLPRLPVFGDGILAGEDPATRLVYLGMIQFAPANVPKGAELTGAAVELIGGDARYLDPQAEARWTLDLLSPGVDEAFPRLLAPALADAPKDATLEPVLTQADLAVGRANTFRFAPGDLPLALNRTLSFRLNGDALGSRRAIFIWDSGAGGHPPVLRLEYLPPVIERP